MMRSVGLALALCGHAHAHAPELTDCRNQTFGEEKNGNLQIMSWHIHYNTNTTGQKLLYEAFMKEFYVKNTAKWPWPPGTSLCPFGPNYGAISYPYVCSLEPPYDDWGGDNVVFKSRLGGMPWNGPQRAFYFPLAYIQEAWDWVNANRFHTDVLRHPNTGCMHDDHSVRANWTAEDPNSVPVINIANFPCNVPGTGCNDTLFGGPPACNCDSRLPLPDDSPEEACQFCIPNGGYIEDLTFGCTKNDLQVDYTHVKYYSGKVSCGNLFLDSDIGAGINTPPVVKYPAAKDGTYYTLIMIDPDADLPNNGSWPDVLTPGSHATVRHWVVGDIDAASMRSGNFSCSTCKLVWPFVGPAPPYGSHRYGQFVFAQGHKHSMKLYKATDPKTNWDYKGWLATYGMSSPVASNWHIVQKGDPRSAVLDTPQVTVI